MRKIQLIGKLLSLSLLWIGTLSAAFPLEQSAGSLSGYVYDSSSREPLVSATVLLKETNSGRYTNADGYFLFPELPYGTYHLSIRYIGYKPKDVTVRITPERPQQTIHILLSPRTVQIDEVTVEAEQEIEKREVIVSRVQLPVEQLKAIRIAGEQDIFRTIQYLPGVLSSSQLSSGLYIRGGSPDQNLILLDDATVYNPSHVFGFYSTFNPEAIKDIQLYKGGFPAEYGDRLSAVLDITQKEGNKREYHGKIGVGLLSSQLSVEGPIPLPFESSFFFAGRRTYLEVIRPFLPEDPENPLPDFYFYDLNGKLTFRPFPNDKIMINGFLTRDILSAMTPGTDFLLGITNRAVSLRWNHIFNPKLLATAVLASSYYENQLTGTTFGYDFSTLNSIEDQSLKVTIEYYPNDRLSLKSGVEYRHYNFLYYQNFSGSDTALPEGSGEFGRINIPVNDFTISSFLQASYKLSDLLLLQAGFRTLRMDLRNLTVGMPRFAIRYQFHPDYALKLAWGMYKQYFYLAYQPNFSFFDTWFPVDPLTEPPTAQHYILSLESSAFSQFKLSLDLYYKPMKHIAEFNRYSLAGTTVRDIFFFGKGTAYGAEIFLQKSHGKITGWIGYAYGFVQWQIDSINYGEPFNPRYDRRHDFKIVLNYNYSPKWQFSASFLFQSGQPYTGITSRFQSKLPGDNVGRGVVIPSQRYGLRLPPSHQLNFGVRYSTHIFGKYKALISLDIFNVYSRRDILTRFYDTTSEKTVVTDIKLLPIVPSISMEVSL